MSVLPTPRDLRLDEARVRQAMDVAKQTPKGDVPVGAVIFAPDGQVLATATNRRETDSDPTAHAEILAIRRAARRFTDGWRLTECTIAVTLEPCAMCAGAIVGARMGRLIFGAFEGRTGACGSVIDVVRDPAVVHRLEVRGGILEAECAQIMADFFTDLRR